MGPGGPDALTFAVVSGSPQKERSDRGMKSKKQTEGGDSASGGEEKAEMAEEGPLGINVQGVQTTKGKKGSTKAAPAWVTWGEYQLAPQWREYAFHQLGVPSDNVTVDLFAKEGKNARPLFINKVMDAFSFEWSKLVEDEGKVLWANPPFALLGRVVAKICQEPCRVALCCPESPETSWWHALQRITVARVQLPGDQSLYYGTIKKDILPPPNWRTVVCLVDSREKKGPEPTPKIRKWLAQRCKAKGLHELIEVLDTQRVPEETEAHTPPPKGREEGGEPGTEQGKSTQKSALGNDPHSGPISGMGVRGVESKRATLVDCEIHLRMRATLGVEGLEKRQVRVLIDTGAEVCLVRQGLLPEGVTTPADRPLRLMAANNQRLPGGGRVVIADLQFEAVEWDNRKKMVLTAPTLLYEAAMEEDILLSYQWLAERNIDVCPRKHGLRTRMGNAIMWMPGERVKPMIRANARLAKEPMFVQAAPVQALEAETPSLRALDLFCGGKSVAKVLEKWGYKVETLDMDPKRDPTLCVDVLQWNYREKFPPGYFHIVAASPPCTEYSAAKTTGVRDLEKADAIVKKTLEIIEYLAPSKWWLETPRTGILARTDFMRGYPQVDVDYCQFEECGFQKPTRFFGSKHLEGLPPVLCDQKNCSSLRPLAEGAATEHRAHLRPMGGKERGVRREVAYHIPEGVVEYVAGLGVTGDRPEDNRGKYPHAGEKEEVPPVDPELLEGMERVRFMRLRALPEKALEDEGVDEEYAVLEEVARRFMQMEKTVSIVKGGPETREAAESPLAGQLRQALLDEFGQTSLSGKYVPNPPVRGPFGEAEIWLKPDAKPVSVPPYQMTGERRQALIDLVEKARQTGKLESGKGPWNTPAFPVPKKVQGSYRLVQDLRPQNEATIKDGHPLPRIGEIVQRQGKIFLWTTLDLVDGFHQMPLKKEHRYITCMSTPQGTQQWTVQVMGLKNAGTQFQRMMEWELQNHPDSDPYVDDVITGSQGPSEEEALWENYHAIRAVMLKFREDQIVCNPEKSAFFQREVQFCGHILREGRRSPAPGKLLPIQKWELPRTVTELRGFLGLTNYFSEYVHHYAEVAAPLMAKLRLNRQDGKKGSRLRLL